MTITLLKPWQFALIASDIQNDLAKIDKIVHITGMHAKDVRAPLTEIRKALEAALVRVETLEQSLRDANHYVKPLKGTQENPDKQQTKKPR